MHKYKLVALAAVGAILLAAGAATSVALATPPTSTDACPAGSPYATGYTCTYEPANVKTYKKVVVKKKIREEIRQYEEAHDVVATINEGPPMSGAGCIDPTTVKKWGFHVGDTFKNTDKYHHYFLDTWQAGWEVCNWHLVKIDGQWYVEGTKANCHNEHILIPVRHSLPRHHKRVVVFRSVKSFKLTYQKWVTKRTHYYCDKNWILHYNGKTWVCYLPIPVTTTTPTTGTTVTTTTTVTTSTTETTTTTSSSPPTINWNTIQEMYPNESQPVCVRTTIPAGEGSGSVDFSVTDSTNAGFFVDSTEPAANGSDKVCATYQAPSEVGSNTLKAVLNVPGQQSVHDETTVQIITPPSP